LILTRLNADDSSNRTPLLTAQRPLTLLEARQNMVSGLPAQPRGKHHLLILELEILLEHLERVRDRSLSSGNTLVLQHADHLHSNPP
jgi:hypothetical protein